MPTPFLSGGSGQRHFFSDETLVIRVNNVAVASGADPDLASLVVVLGK